MEIVSGIGNIGWQHAWMPRFLNRTCGNPVCEDTGSIWHVVMHATKGVVADDAWYCSGDCFKAASETEFTRLISLARRPAPIRNRMPLGLVLVSCGLITEDELKAVLKAQQEAGQGRLGEWVQRLGFVSERDVIRALGTQWRCPALLPTAQQYLPAELIPLRLLEAFRMVPIHHVVSTNKLYVAFEEGVHHSALLAVERMTGCVAEACVTSQSIFDRELARIRGMARTEVCFESVMPAFEMSQICGNYAAQWRADKVRSAAARGFVWVRMEKRKRRALDLVFRVSSEKTACS